MHVGDLFGSKFVALLINCGYPNNVYKLYNSKPQRLFVPIVHQLVAMFCIKIINTILQNKNFKALLEKTCSKAETKISILYAAWCGKR